MATPGTPRASSALTPTGTTSPLSSVATSSLSTPASASISSITAASPTTSATSVAQPTSTATSSPSPTTATQATISSVATIAPTSTVFTTPSAASPSILTVSTSSAVLSTVTGPTQEPSTTIAGTTTVVSTQTSAPGQTSPVIVTSFSTQEPTTAPARSSQTSSSAASAPTSSSPTSLTQNGNPENNGGGIGTKGTVAIAVVIPVVVVGLLVAAGIFFFRKRKQKKSAQEARRKEVEEYGYNPNNDPTLPAVGGADSPEMTEDSSGYRGWGNNTAGSARKPSTNLSSGIGMAVSDDGQHQPSSPEHLPSSDGGHSEQPLVDGHTGAVAGAGGAVGAGALAGGMKRGPSNASSQYSAAGQTDDSDDRPAEHGYDTNYSQYTPYRPGATNYEDTTQPVIQDVSARRNTKIENPSTLPRQGNSGIAANF